MYSKVKIFGHPVHPMLVAFPVAFYTAAMACFIAYYSNGDAFWFKTGFVANLAGVGMAVIAALPGFVDWMNIPSGQTAKKTGAAHMTLNVLALLLFAANASMLYGQWNDPQPQLFYALPLTIGGFACTLIAGFLGWTLVQKHHVGVSKLSEHGFIHKTDRTATHDTSAESAELWKAAKGEKKDLDRER